MYTTTISNKFRLFSASALILISALFFIGGPDYDSPRSFRAAWNLGHIIYFTLLPLVILYSTHRIRLKPVGQALFALLMTIVLGTTVELIQSGLNRTLDFSDIIRNIIGALVAIFFFMPFRKLFPGSLLYVFKGLIIFLILLQMHPMFIALIDEHHARRDFPVLSDFETPYQRHRWIGSSDFIIVKTHNGSNHAMQVSFTTDKYSDVRIKYFPRDWNRYLGLQFRVYNPTQSTLALSCRIHDKKHDQSIRRYNDRFTRTYSISQGWNTINIDMQEILQSPETRTMDLDQINEIAFFTYRLPETRIIFLDELKLFR